MPIWNPWHGCRKISPGCQNCYVYRRDESVGRDASVVAKNGDFDLPLRRGRDGNYKLRPEDGPVFACMTSDMFIEEADRWRTEIWDMIRTRSDLEFIIITKRIARFTECVPPDWGAGYPNVTVCCTAENQQMADARLPVFLNAPIRHKRICHEPMLGPVNIEPYLESGQIEYVLCGGESGEKARPCRYEWVLDTRRQCEKYGVEFHFKQTGAVFEKDGRTYHIPRKIQHSQAKKAGIDYIPELNAEKEESLNGAHGSFDGLFERIARSKFRSSFHLTEADKKYVREKGAETIRRHAEDFVRKRLAPADIPNDGKQTPMRGHPVFPAQHACGCCCRGCLEKWHGIAPNTQLDDTQQRYVVDVIMEWIRRQMAQ